jgi:four helix bundle protein
MGDIRSYRDLDGWRKAMELAEGCYRLTDRFPRSEQFGLTSQMRRAAVSIASNIAEGHNRRSRQAYANFVSIALGSQAELETQAELAIRLGYVTQEAAAPLVALAADVGRILHGLSRSLETPGGRTGAKVQSPSSAGVPR